MGKRAKFIVFEGVDHCGKTTQLDRTEVHLRLNGLDVARFREPGGTKIGEGIRSMLLDKEHTKLTAKTELMLFFASRVQLLEEEILPALRAGRTVLADRYYYSSAAYQGTFLYGANWVLNFAEEWLRLPEPDLVVYLDGDPEILAKRVQGRELDRIEGKGLAYQKKVREAFLSMADYRDDLFRTISCERQIDVVWEDIKKVLEEHVLETFNAPQ